MKTPSEFTNQLFGLLAPGEFIEIRTIAGGKARSNFYGNAEEAAKAAILAAERAEVYFGVATRDGKGGKKANIVRIPAVWADVDAKDGLDGPIDRIARAPVEPSAVVISGNGCHAYWFLDQPAGRTEIGRIERLNKAIAAVVEGDSTYDASRVLRVPGRLNHKGNPPIPVTVVLLERDRRYSLEALEEAFGATAEPAPVVRPDTPLEGSSAESCLPCRAKLWAGVDEGSRNTACFYLAADLKRQGIPQEVAYHTLSNWNDHNSPPMPEEELSNTLASVYSTEHAGLGCDKHPMLDFCQPNCPVKCKATTAQAPSPFQPEARQESTATIPVWTWQALLSQDFTPPEFVVSGLIPRRGVTLLTGEGGIGKSFVTLELAYSVASGSDFLGNFSTVQGPVLMLDLENDESTIALRARKITAGRQNGATASTSIPVFVARKGELPEARINLEKDRPALCRAIEAYCPVLLVIDPLVAVHGHDENNNVEMRVVISTLQDIARQHNLAVVVVHHPRKRGLINDGGQMIRGASDLRNAVDSHLFLRKASADRVLVEHDKSRHAQPLPKFTIELSDSEDGTATYIRYAGAATESLEKEAAAREAIRSILEEHAQLQRGLLLSMVSAQGIKKSTAERALSSLQQEGVVVQREKRGPYCLGTPQGELDV